MSATLESSPLYPTLARAQLPRRVRRALEQVYTLAADEMARALERMLAEFEQQLFRQADQAVNPGQQQFCFDTLRMVRQNRADLIPQFLSGLEAALAGIRMNAVAPDEPTDRLHFGELRLVEDQELDEGSVLRAISSRHEARASLPLHLLGQRFGVLACAPAYDAEHLPVGPHRLCAIMAHAGHVLQIDPQPRLELFRCFDQYALHGYRRLVEALNATLVRENILPDLAYVPIRARPALASELSGEAGRERRGQDPGRAAAGTAAVRPYTGWLGGVESGGIEIGSEEPREGWDRRAPPESGEWASARGCAPQERRADPAGGSGGAPGPMVPGPMVPDLMVPGPAGSGPVAAGGDPGGGGNTRDPVPTGPGAWHAPAGAAAPADEARRGRHVRQDPRIDPAGARRTGETDVPGDFAQLQRMLAARRAARGKPSPHDPAHAGTRGLLSTEDVVQALQRMQDAAIVAPSHRAARTPRSVHEVRQALLAQTRQWRGEAAALSRDDDDAFELVGILLAEVQRQLRRDAPSNQLLQRLIVPLLRLVLQDRAFFSERTHPARQLLNAVAESGAAWVPAEDSDPQLNERLRHAIDEVVTRFHGDPAVFDDVNHRVQQHLQALARRAEVAERRHIEAARGRERLELARRRAGEVIAEASRGRRLPHFVQALLAKAWTDVLTLTLLRHDEASDEWQRQLAATRAITQATALDQPSPAPPELAARIEQSLALVGYHAQEAADIARHLTAGVGDDPAGGASRTELAMKLKMRERLGQDTPPPRPELPPRDEREQDAYQVLRSLPFGTWFEFVLNQQGDVVRRRLSWYSTLTGHALFVNQRGQRVAEQSLDALARAMVQDQVRIVTVEHGNLVERAWRRALNVLRGFPGGDPVPGELPA